MYAMAMFPSTQVHRRPASAPVDLFLAQRQTPVDCHFHIFVARKGVSGSRYIPSYSSLLVGIGRTVDSKGLKDSERPMWESFESDRARPAAKMMR